MIKILKEGRPQKFTTTCPDCGCEFEYELEDVKTDYSICLTTYPGQYNTYVICPCCGKHIHHGTIKAEGYISLPTSNKLNDAEYNPCDTCSNRFGTMDGLGNPVVEDSPCQWCSLYKYKFTCNILGDANESKN